MTMIMIRSHSGLQRTMLHDIGHTVHLTWTRCHTVCLGCRVFITSLIIFSKVAPPLLESRSGHCNWLISTTTMDNTVCCDAVEINELQPVFHE